MVYSHLVQGNRLESEAQGMERTTRVLTKVDAYTLWSILAETPATEHGARRARRDILREIFYDLATSQRPSETLLFRNVTSAEENTGTRSE